MSNLRVKQLNNSTAFKPLGSYVLKFFALFLDLLFPKFCVSCRLEGTFLCINCKKEIVLVLSPTCPTCQKITENGQFCSKKCRKKSLLSGIMAAAYFKEGPLKEAIHAFKYEFIKDLGEELAKLLVLRLKNKIPGGKKAILAPVPLHRKKLSERGFNQAEVLARVVSNFYGLELHPNLISKVKPTTAQIKLKGKERLKNLVGTFEFDEDKNKISGRTIILVDDVATTGTTLNESAKVLKKAGAKSVWGLVLARG